MYQVGGVSWRRCHAESTLEVRRRYDQIEKLKSISLHKSLERFKCQFATAVFLDHPVKAPLLTHHSVLS